MDKNGGQLKSNDVPNNAQKLPAEIVGRILQKLSVGDRLKSERVSPRWKRALAKWGWVEQRRLSRDIVFEGASEEELARFWQDLDDGGSCHLITLFDHIGQSLLDLDFHSFSTRVNLERFVPKIAESLQSFTKLEKINIEGFNLSEFADHLPDTLRELRTSGGLMSVDTLEALARRCPRLEEVPFQNLAMKELDAVIALIGKFPRQKRLNLNGFWFWAHPIKEGALASIGALTELETLELRHCYGGLDDKSLEAIAGGCPRLRLFHFDIITLTERGLARHLPKLPSLTALVVNDRHQTEEFTDAVLESIAQRGQLKKLAIRGADLTRITDNAIVSVIDRCKSLVSLDFYRCPQITERSLGAVVAEVRRRHGTSSPWAGTLPIGPLDPEIFYFASSCYPGGIAGDAARELIGDNPWIIFDDVDPREDIY